MANPYLPNWEYIPDGEPRVFGDRVYIYGSHDKPDSETYCDHKLKVWSASVDDLENWVCHGVSFQTIDSEGRKSDVDWTDNLLFAPDVVEKDGKYYLYAYIVDDKGCVAVSDNPEGPFTLVSQYKFNVDNSEGQYDNPCDGGTFIDPGVIVDDDGRVFIYCGFTRSYLCELNPDNMYEVIDGSYQENFLPSTGDEGFYEAASMRKIGDTYYMIYSPNIGSRLAYATAPSPTGPFTYRGYIVDNGVDFPGGNDHGSIACIKGQWYIFYHRMTNGTDMSRRGFVERIEILPDGTIPPVEMTSLGFSEGLNPYEITPADTACVLRNGGMITELDTFTRLITDIRGGTVMGWKYFEFGEDFTSDEYMKMELKLRPMGCSGKLNVYADEVKEDNKIGEVSFDRESSVVCGKVKKLTGRHGIFIEACGAYTTWAKYKFENRNLIELIAFVFKK
ncbi:MAG: family 43 glycosylhydrolase [Lachnospiraceae bacterium]|nr:family 43 glycosylhydrolase [Lachnospiraceae bacterium]